MGTLNVPKAAKSMHANVISFLVRNLVRCHGMDLYISGDEHIYSLKDTRKEGYIWCEKRAERVGGEAEAVR